jgi:uncharacterized cupin superfamily protein
MNHEDPHMQSASLTGQSSSQTEPLNEATSVEIHREIAVEAKEPQDDFVQAAAKLLEPERQPQGLLARVASSSGAKSIVIEAAASAHLEPAPISPDWILAGTPEARSKVLANSHDRTASIVVWECTAGRFNWHYSEEETVVVISGEAFITTEKGEERRLGQGYLGFFPAGSSCTWRINDRVKKVAILRKELPPLLSFGVRGWNKLLRIVGLRGRSSMMPR